MKETPFTTRPLSTSKQGITRFISIADSTPVQTQRDKDAKRNEETA
jgi:hypothetical protein